VVQEVDRERWAEIRGMSGEEEEQLLGRKVGKSEFRMQKLLMSMPSAKFTPLAAEVEELVVEHQFAR
jgi:hypothetical protein